MNDSIKTQVSAYIDGELPANEAELLLRRMSQGHELRQQAAEYLAMGRLIRGERLVPGIENLRQRISDELDDKSAQQDFDVPDSAGPRYVRPLAGFAIAATVALAAIFGLQQTASMTDINMAPGSDSAAVAELENALETWKQYTSNALQQNVNPIWTNRVGYVDWIKITDWVEQDIKIAKEKSNY